tara:strand:+ start:43 stop:360 length:318 start_codon:yes stop_codon:yes gene_type:complete
MILDDSKTEQIEIIDLKNKTSIAEHFIIATCRSSKHANAVADEILKKLKKIGIKCPTPEGRPQCDWVIVDAGSVIIHLFRSEIRQLYNLEKLWNITFDSVENKTA